MDSSMYDSDISIFILVELMNEDLLIKYLNNQCNPKELETVIHWIGNEAGRTSGGRTLIEKDWNDLAENKFTEYSDDKFTLLLNKIHHQININGKTRVEVTPANRNKVMLSWVTRAAAILLFPVLAFMFYVFSNPLILTSRIKDGVVDSLEISAPIGSRTSVQLSDGTIVHLNCGSKIRYPRFFVGKTRELTLVGEGFFEVNHDPKHPFIVKAKNVQIKALGTKFNVMTYPENDLVSTTLVEGKVVLDKNANGITNTLESLTPGQHVDYNTKTGKISIAEGDMRKFIAWKDGLLVFDNASIAEVSERLSRIFNVDVKFSEDIKDYTYTVKFVDESLVQILELLTHATPVNFKLCPREKLPDGTYSKQKILLEKRKTL
jgi:Fe2+-dicitrate sensor, membrane component